MIRRPPPTLPVKQTRQAAGPHGTVVAVDLTPEMLRHARSPGSRCGRRAHPG
jgi:hypothetical protein